MQMCFKCFMGLVDESGDAQHKVLIQSEFFCFLTKCGEVH